MSFTPNFFSLPKKQITLDAIKSIINDDETKRINFSTTHKNALNKNDSIGKINLPFYETIGPFIEAKLGINSKLFKSKYGFWRAIKNEEEYNYFKIFVETYKNTVFLRDNLDLSACLSMNFNDDDRHTEIGELEVKAKFHDNTQAETTLVKICAEWLNSAPYYKLADYVCAMPCTNKDETSLPRRIINSLEEFDFEDISEYVFWKSKKRKVKDAESIEEKLAILEESNLQIDKDLSGKTVLLFDDLYMSGLSLQYVAMKLKEAGAERVFGLCLVKSRSNTTR